jgi:intracellular septation protein A
MVRLPFLTQLLPLLVFIAVDALVTDVRWSVASAVVFAVGQLVYTWARQRRLDWLVLVDVGLIVGLGGISIAFDDEIFFKVKPAIIEGISIVFVVGLLLAPDRFLLAYFRRMMPTLGADALSATKSMLVWMSFFTALHLVAVLYTAFRSSKQTWAWVSGPGFYLVLVPVAFVVLVKRYRRRSSQIAS